MWINNAEDVFSTMNLIYPNYAVFRTEYKVAKNDPIRGASLPTEDQIVSLDLRYAYGTNAGAEGGLELSKQDLDGDWQLILRLTPDDARHMINMLHNALNSWRRQQIIVEQDGR